MCCQGKEIIFYRVRCRIMGCAIIKFKFIKIVYIYLNNSKIVDLYQGQPKSTILFEKINYKYKENN